MATAALAWAIETPTGHPAANLVLIQLGEQTTHRLGNWIYLGSRPDLAARCDLQLVEVDLALDRLARLHLITPLDRHGDQESWIVFPRSDVDLVTLRRWWQTPVRRPSYRPPGKRVRLAVYRRDGFRCRECQWGPPVPDDYDGSYALWDESGRRCLMLDHVTPRTAGGKSVADNLQALCTQCNGSKGARV